MRTQLRHLVEMSKRPNVELQVLPFSEGWHPGTVGSFSMLEFPEDVHSPVSYVVSQAGDAYLEREDDMRRVTLTYTHLHAAALSASKSRDLIAAIARDLA
ncbi:Scr1 family TA system antitoxin-like transcriptional regulator [Plantactinospora sp. WMMB334]|uniref:Scr1 family TA system antitoxin-like transcriptional regulator n=1 Tax=Plantactinospora sp. WMMB334 TaxID=3404119 RepID=UPI003B962CA3